ncbi:MAG: DUF3365 domain-containing protein [Desulfobacterium sp.]|jgi:signal transduction histidine kinase|nr:DUF3365 domain-containing protein [Desulfobacterium sp.]
MPPYTFSLRLKFISGLVLFAFTLGICIGVIMYFHYNSIMESEISQRSRMLLAQSDAVQDYVKTVLRPEMFKTLPKGRFVLKAMSSSYISRQVMARLNINEASDYHYRRVSRNPRNPASTPDSFEAGLIEFFRTNRDAMTWEDTTRIKDRDYHMVARPVTFVESCMQCHGNPGDAPKELIADYGGANGFDYVMGEVGGVVVAGFPVDMIKTPARELTYQYLSLSILGIIFFAALISLFFDRLVMKNLHRLSDVFKQRFSGEDELPIIERLGQKDEIEGLVDGVEELAVCLANARNELLDHAQNLERRVEERTQALDIKARKHLGDARLFVTLLADFGRSQESRQLILNLLKSVGERYGAVQAVYHCTVVSQDYYAWKEEHPVAPPSPEIRELLWKNEILMEERQLFIPVTSYESHWGILNLIWEESPDPGDFDPDILLALGQQMAILIENIHAFSNIRFQHDMLQSVFNGICNPLLLIDRECRIIIANQGSRILFDSEDKAEQKKLLAEFLSFQNKSTGAGLVEKVATTGQPVSQEIQLPDNRYFDIELYPLETGGDPSGMKMVLYARDVTREKEMVDRMHQAERLSAIGKMAAGIAHEINNPLGVIQVYADLVKDGVEDHEILQDLDVILKHTRSAKKVVRDLLNLARPKKNLSGTCDINHVLESELEVFKAQARARQISVSLDLSPDLPKIDCDASVAEQIMTNLWLNAVDSLQGREGRIALFTGHWGANEVCFAIEDNGPGISDENLAHIFDPFFTTKAVGKGTGLGLSVVYGFVNELGGGIEVKKNMPGTRFNVFFPVKSPSDKENGKEVDKEVMKNG